MMVVRILRKRRHKADADTDIVSQLKTFRSRDDRVGVAAQEFLAMHVGAWSERPIQPWLDRRKRIRQGTYPRWPTPRIFQGFRQMATDRQSACRG